MLRSYFVSYITPQALVLLTFFFDRWPQLRSVPRHSKWWRWWKQARWFLLKSWLWYPDKDPALKGLTIDYTYCYNVYPVVGSLCWEEAGREPIGNRRTAEQCGVRQGGCQEEGEEDEEDDQGGWGASKDQSSNSHLSCHLKLHKTYHLLFFSAFLKSSRCGKTRAFWTGTAMTTGSLLETWATMLRMRSFLIYCFPLTVLTTSIFRCCREHLVGIQASRWPRCLQLPIKKHLNV